MGQSRSAYVPGTATQSRIWRHLAAHEPGADRTPDRKYQQVSGRFAWYRWAPPAGFEPAHTAPEAVALSPELWGLAQLPGMRSRHQAEDTVPVLKVSPDTAADPRASPWRSRYPHPGDEWTGPRAGGR